MTVMNFAFPNYTRLPWSTSQLKELQTADRIATFFFYLFVILVAIDVIIAFGLPSTIKAKFDKYAFELVIITFGSILMLGLSINGLNKTVHRVTDEIVIKKTIITPHAQLKQIGFSNNWQKFTNSFGSKNKTGYYAKLDGINYYFKSKNVTTNHIEVKAKKLPKNQFKFVIYTVKPGFETLRSDLQLPDNHATIIRYDALK